MHIDAQTKSLHYIQMYSVKDRIDLGKLSNVRPTCRKSLYDLLQSAEDYEKLNKSFAAHVARVMVEHIPFFTEDFSSLVQRHIPHQPKWHIPHQCSREMSLKPEVVSLYTDIAYCHSICILCWAKWNDVEQPINCQTPLITRWLYNTTEVTMAIALDLVGRLM